MDFDLKFDEFCERTPNPAKKEGLGSTDLRL